jgi:phage-related protein (TIGR01555 family)|nr:MAG TPA_asm: Portal [Caudoviricetes sp.]
MSRKNRKKQTIRNDSFSEAFISNGIKQYRANNTYFEGPLINYNLLQRLWSNRLAQRISSLPAEAALKNGFIIDGDKDNLILQSLDELQAEAKLIEALTWARHYGRSCIFMIIDDGGSEEDEVNYDNIRSIKSLEVYDKQCIIEDSTGLLINDDPLDDNFGKTEWYQIIPPGTGKTYYVHHSRLLLFDGDLLPAYERIARGGGGMSCLEGVVKAIYRNDTAQSTALNALERISTALLQLNGIKDLLQSDEGTAIVRRRLDLIDMARNLLNTIAIDTEDKYQVFNIPITGISNLLDNFGQYICALTGIPFTVLFGRSPAGLNSTGNGDLENYYNDVVGKIQKRALKGPLEKLIKTLQLSKLGPAKGTELDNWTIKFNPLWSPSDKEQAETENTRSDAKKTEVDTICSLLDRQLMDDSEARKYLAEKTDYPIKLSRLNLNDEDE